jgi:hypothetical protein
MRDAANSKSGIGAAYLFADKKQYDSLYYGQPQPEKAERGAAKRKPCERQNNS